MEPTLPPFGATRAPFPADDATSGSSKAPLGSSRPPLGATPGRGTAGGEDLTFKDIVALLHQALLIIRTRWYWGVLGALLLAGPAGYLLYHRPVEYTAQTALLAQSTLDKVIGSNDGNDGSDQARENNLRNHLSMMTSRNFLSSLTASFNAEEKARIASPYLKAGGLVDDEFFQEFFAHNVSIERERGREYYTITVTHQVPAVAILVADRLANQYLHYVQQAFRAASIEGFAMLERQARLIRADMAQSEADRLDFRKKNGIISRTDNQGILGERLKRLDASLTDFRVKRRGLETLTKQAQLDRASSAYPWDNAYLASFANNEALRQELDRQMAQRAVLASRYGPKHPKMRDIDSQITGIQSSIQRNFDVAVHDLEAQLEVATQNESLVKKEFEEAFDSSIEIEKLASNYELLSAGVESKRITLNGLERKIADASISSNLPADFMQIVDPAYIVKPRLPKRVLYALLVALLAVGTFITCPLVVSALDERVSGAADVEQVLGLNLIGGIHSLKLRAEDRAHVVRNKTDLVVTEAFVGIVGQLELGQSQSYPKVIVVTSSLPGEGKSLVASNLASTFTQLGKKTVLVDLDLRRPTQHTLHGIAGDQGFLSWATTGFPAAQSPGLPGSTALLQLVDGTRLICAGGAEAQPSRFLISEAMERLVDQLKDSHDVVILDTPPAAVFQDALMLARYARVRVLVARDGIAPVAQVRQVIEDFSKAGLPFQGLVLNGYSPNNSNKKLAYSYKGAAQGYTYGAAASARVQRVNGTHSASGTKARPAAARQ